MTYKIVDLRTEKVLGTYETEEQATKAESRLVHDPGETWYEIKAPEVTKPKTKKARVKKESD
jgi:hypothetical protein